jgi:hypothetical protein
MHKRFRVLKPNRFASIMVLITIEGTFEDPSVTSFAQREELFNQADHVRLYGWEEFKDRLEDTALRTTTFTAAQIVGENKTFRFRVQPEHDAVFGETVFICEKSSVQVSGFLSSVHDLKHFAYSVGLPRCLRPLSASAFSPAIGKRRS